MSECVHVFITIIARAASTESASVPSVHPLALWRGKRGEKVGEGRRGEEEEVGGKGEG